MTFASFFFFSPVCRYLALHHTVRKLGHSSHSASLQQELWGCRLILSYYQHHHQHRSEDTMPPLLQLEFVVCWRGVMGSVVRVTVCYDLHLVLSRNFCPVIMRTIASCIYMYMYILYDLA